MRLLLLFAVLITIAACKNRTGLSDSALADTANETEIDSAFVVGPLIIQMVEKTEESLRRLCDDGALSKMFGGGSASTDFVYVKSGDTFTFQPIMTGAFICETSAGAQYLMSFRTAAKRIGLRDYEISDPLVSSARLSQGN